MLPLGFTAFMAFGVVLVLLGASQADLARALSLDLAQSGLLGSVLALGIGVGVVAAGPLFDRHARRPLFVGSTLLAAAALGSVDADTGFSRLLVHLFATGVGVGAYDTLINAAVVEMYGDRSARPMSIVHAGATIGAVLGPLGVAWLAADGWHASFVWTGGAHLPLAALALFVRFPPPPPRGNPRPAAEGRDEPTDRAAHPPVFSRALLPLAGVAFAYVGVEAALTIFAIPYAGDSLSLPPDAGRIAISGFWLGLLGGRLAVLALPGALGAGVLIAAGAGSSVMLAAGVGLALPRVELLFGAVGVTLGCVYPLMIALTGQRFPHAPGTAAGLAAGAGALGGFAVPWLTGALGDAYGTSVALLSVAGWGVVIALCAVWARRSA